MVSRGTQTDTVSDVTLRHELLSCQGLSGDKILSNVSLPVHKMNIPALYTEQKIFRGNTEGRGEGKQASHKPQKTNRKRGKTRTHASVSLQHESNTGDKTLSGSSSTRSGMRRRRPQCAFVSKTPNPLPLTVARADQCACKTMGQY